MKKNLMSVLILVLCLVNLVFNALIVFTLLPQSKQLNNMITDVCQAINLNLKSGSATGADSVPPEEIEVYNVAAGEKLTVSVSGGGYVQFTVSLSLNTNSDNHDVYTSEVLTSQDSIITSSIRNIISSYTLAEIQDKDKFADITDEMLAELQTMYGKDYVIAVNIASLMVVNN